MLDEQFHLCQGGGWQALATAGQFIEQLFQPGVVAHNHDALVLVGDCDQHFKICVRTGAVKFAQQADFTCIAARLGYQLGRVLGAFGG